MSIELEIFEMVFFIVSYFSYVILKSKKSFHMLQQNFYNNSNRYLKWIKNNPKKTLVTWDFVIIPIIFLLFYFNEKGMILSPIYHIYLILGFFYSWMFFYYFKKYKKESVIISFKITSRVKRMFITWMLLYGLVILFTIGVNARIGLYIFMFLSSLNAFFIYLINLINKPAEKMVYYHYFHKAKKKIKEDTRLNVIGVTGSYGKTSSKNILADILRVKYDTLPTPKNFNTPYGLMLTINNHLDKFTEYLVAEMGACEVGQIKELCDFVKPKYGILTKIGVAHLESFKTEENIQKTKFELIESLPEDGIGILNMDDAKQVNYKIKNNCHIRWIAIDNQDADLVASNIKGTPTGMSFDVRFKGDKKKYKLETKLLGSANVYNILAAVMLAFELGMSMEEIQMGVKGINTIPNRLELKKVGGLTLIDDGYNSNPVGAKMALDTLALMPGKKIVVTPGMIELKDKQYELNYEFGRQISKVADIVVLVNKKQTKPILDGLLKEGYKKKNIYVYDDIYEAFNLLRKISDPNTFILIENDLPDIFTESGKKK